MTGFIVHNKTHSRYIVTFYNRNQAHIVRTISEH